MSFSTHSPLELGSCILRRTFSFGRILVVLSARVTSDSSGKGFLANTRCSWASIQEAPTKDAPMAPVSNRTFCTALCSILSLSLGMRTPLTTMLALLMAISSSWAVNSCVLASSPVYVQGCCRPL